MTCGGLVIFVECHHVTGPNGFELLLEGAGLFLLGVEILAFDADNCGVFAEGDWVRRRDH